MRRLLFISGVITSGYIIWQKRFSIQRMVHALGIKTPLLPGTMIDSARHVAPLVNHRFNHGATLAEHLLSHQKGA